MKIFTIFIYAAVSFIKQNIWFLLFYVEAMPSTHMFRNFFILNLKVEGYFSAYATRMSI